MVRKCNLQVTVANERFCKNEAVSCPTVSANNQVLCLLFRLLGISVLIFCGGAQALGQLTARNADDKRATSYVNTYGNRDTIFVFNQMPQPRKGILSLQYSTESAFDWYRFNYADQKFEDEPFATIANATATMQDTLSQGGYRVTVTPAEESTPDTAFVAWLYLNPGFDFQLRKDDNGEVMTNNRLCMFTNFPLDRNAIASSFVYYDPDGLPDRPLTLANPITFAMKRGNDAEIVTLLNTQGDRQYLRDNSPPHEDMRYQFRVYDLFGIEKNDDIMYRTILPYTTLNTPVLPDVDPTSAPVPVMLTCQPNDITLNNDTYVWRFGTGDSIMYDAENPPPETVEFTYYTPKKSGYQLELSVTSRWGCTYVTPPVTVTVDDPVLDVANVFTPNGDGNNDFFKPVTVSLRQFEISIYTRTGKRVYHYKGNDLRNWEGWDGRIQNTGKEAAEGVYFFEIRALGWDEPPTRFNDKSRKQNPPQTFGGAFHLFR